MKREHIKILSIGIIMLMLLTTISVKGETKKIDEKNIDYVNSKYINRMVLKFPLLFSIYVVIYKLQTLRADFWFCMAGFTGHGAPPMCPWAADRGLFFNEKAENWHSLWRNFGEKAGWFC